MNSSLGVGITAVAGPKYARVLVKPRVDKPLSSLPDFEGDRGSTQQSFETRETT